MKPKKNKKAMAYALIRPLPVDLLIRRGRFLAIVRELYFAYLGRGEASEIVITHWAFSDMREVAFLLGHKSD